MSDKKTLSTEQLQKMQEGRKRAYEARKKAREEEKEAKKQAKLAAKKEQEEAIKQQREQRELIKKANEAKAKKKGDLSALKVKKEEVVAEPESDKTPPQVDFKPIEEEPAEKEEETVVEPEETEDEKYKRVFETASLKVLNSLPNNAKELFKKANSKFDCNLSVDDNIKSMIEYCKEIVKANVKTSEVVKKHIEDKTKEDVQPPVEQVQKEREIEQKIYSIMKRFK